MQELNTTIAFGKFSALSTTDEKIREAKQLEADKAAFFASGGTVQTLDSFIDAQDAEDKARIKKWGKTLYDEPAKKKKKTKPPVVEHKTQENLISFAEAGEILGYGETWMRTKINNGHFPMLTIVKVQNGRRLLASEVRALAPEHHKDVIKPKEPDKLTVEQVLDIKRKHKEGVPQTELCRQYDLSPSHVSGIVRGERWKNIKLQEPK